VIRPLFAFAICIAVSSAAIGQARAEDPIANIRILDTLNRCDTSPTDEIVVCGARRDRDRYRIPEIGRGNSARLGDHVRGEAPRASADAAATGSCGIFQGQRRCSRAEMAEAGYGEGRNPITVLGNLLTRLADPDADVGPPPPIP